MARGPRIEVPGGLHHVTARTPRGLTLFRRRGDARFYLELLAAEVREREWSLRSYCLMPTHIHWYAMTPEPDLGDGVKAIHEHFVRVMHARRGTHGHLFGARFHNRLVEDPAHEIACYRYIARNPVEAGLCAAPEDWPWSAHNALAGLAPPPPFLDVEAVRDVISVSAYRSLVATADPALLDQLAADRPDDWLIAAVDVYRVELPTIAQHLRVSVRTVQRRLHDQRVAKGTGPGATADAKGTGPSATA